ncbi:helix-turn-helix domain-containing protein [Pedobacter steynii]
MAIVVKKGPIHLRERRSVVRAIESGMSFKEAQVVFNVSCRSSIKDWIKRFKEENTELSVYNPLEVAKKTTETSEDLRAQSLEKGFGRS